MRFGEQRARGDGPDTSFEFLSSTIERSVEAVSPPTCLRAHLTDLSAYRRVVIVGAGKAAAEGGRLIEETLRNQGMGGAFGGHVTVPWGYGARTAQLEVSEAGWLNSDGGSLIAARAALAHARSAGPDDLVICLLSRGASALWAAPISGISLTAQNTLLRQLESHGARADEMACVIRHLSQIKGGKLARAAHPAKVLTLAVCGGGDDALSWMGLGPTVPDSTTQADAREILSRFGVAQSSEVAQALSEIRHETLCADGPEASVISNRVVASSETMGQAAAAFLGCAGYEVRLIDAGTPETAREIASVHARAARTAAEQGERVAFVATDAGPDGFAPRPPDARNQTYLAALAIALCGAPGVSAAAVSSDGFDSGLPNAPHASAGAFIGPDTLIKATDAGLDCEQLLITGRADLLFSQIGDQISGGATYTDTGDLRIILSEP